MALVICFAGICLAQTKPPAKKVKPNPVSSTKQEQKKEQLVPVSPVKKEQKKVPIVKFSMGMIEGDRFDPEYAGFPVADVIDAIEKLFGPEKSEFESTADFNARQSAALSRKFLGDLSVEDTFAFVVPVVKWHSFSNGLKYEFNPDSSELRLYALAIFSSMNGIGAPDNQKWWRQGGGLDQFDIDFKINSISTYQASNAYGATIAVEKTVSTRLGIAANRMPFLIYNRESSYSNPMPSVEFNMENAKAVRELPALKALVVMKIADPYIVYNLSHVGPTRDRPTEILSQGKYLTGDVLGIVFYSGLTGEIFARLPKTFGKLEPKAEPKPEVKPEGQQD